MDIITLEVILNIALRFYSLRFKSFEQLFAVGVNSFLTLIKVIVCCGSLFVFDIVEVIY